MECTHITCISNTLTGVLRRRVPASGNTKSKSFNLTQGVKQGSIISPYLYSEYTQDFITELLQLEIGSLLSDCTNTSVVAFADDLILMSPTLHRLQLLLNRCVRYGHIPSAVFYNCVGAEILRIGRVSSTSENFKTDGKELLDRALKQGAKKVKLERLLKRNYGRHQALRKFHSNAKKFSDCLVYNN